MMVRNVLRLYEWASEMWFEGHLESLEVLSREHINNLRFYDRDLFLPTFRLDGSVSVAVC